ncbi:GntR family transcriptional regulator [Pseudooceanicola sp. C21-150M6]|uniref:GntR family transcriptional regulator n=1 Tax=Pseudooceanicola sp. C21-150M6 TaxID=3434355 RepID=UPI003D7FB2FF
MYHPLRRRTQPLGEKVYQDLLDDLVEQRRAAGDRLIEAEIARALDVSRTPVREALNRLEKDGLIEGAQPAGYVVIHPSMQDVREIFEIRRALEPVAFVSVVAAAGEEDRVQFRHLQTAVANARTPADSAAANRALRAFWFDRIPNARLRETLTRFHLQVHLVRATTLHSEAGRKAAAEGTRRLLAAFDAGDTAMAHAAMQDFVDAALSFFEQADADRILHATPVPGSDGQDPPLASTKVDQRPGRFTTERTT